MEEVSCRKFKQHGQSWEQHSALLFLSFLCSWLDLVMLQSKKRKICKEPSCAWGKGVTYGKNEFSSLKS